MKARYLLIILLLGLGSIDCASAQESNTAKPPEITIVPGSYEAMPLTEPAPTEEKAKIFSGKKVSITNTKALPQITSNNHRQAFSQTPGLLVSEVTNDSLTSFSYRGFGDPHETFNLNVLQDDIPINFDIYGYPATYYSPPSDFVDQIEFTHGGAALLYGAQPGGALNYRTRTPTLDTELSARTKQVFGSKNLYSTYNEVSGTKDNLSYLIAYHHRQFDGFRDLNSNSRVDFASLKLENKLTENTKLLFEQDIYDGAFGEPGGLSLNAGQDIASFNLDRWQTSLKHDTLSFKRYVTSLGVEHRYDANTQIYSKLWAGFNSRNSKRQAFGTAPTFGGIANGTTNTIQLQESKTLGFQTRASHNWSMFEEKQTFASGIWLYGTDSPFTTETGETPDAEVGKLTRSIDRQTIAGAIFAENKFNYGNLSITPGVRLENISQELDERFNPSASRGLAFKNSNNLVFLSGLGLNYQLPKEFELYANFSQGFKPVTYQDSLPLGPADQVTSDINESKTTNYEAGIRGNPTHYISLDSSLFYSTYSNQFGRVGQTFGNTGRGRYFGVDLATNIDLVTISDNFLKTNYKKSLGVFSIYGNASILNAEFTGGQLDGKTPQYAPRYLIKSGLVYSPKENTKIALLGNFTAKHFADDGNTLSFEIPSYKVWDLTADVSIIKKRLGLVAGINNLFDEKYYSRIRSNGIDPSLPRNFYAGVNLYY